MKLTNADRMRIKLWLEKDPKSSDDGKYLEMNDVTYARTTTYFGPSHEWKVRIAYELETGYPVAMSSPIPGSMDSKKPAGGKYPMVPKLPTKEPVAKKKPAGKGVKPGAFQAAVAAEMANVKNYLSKPSVWDSILADANGKVSFNIHSSPGKGTLKANGLPSGVSYKALKGTKAVYGTYTTYYVQPGYTIPGTFWYEKLQFASVPKGYVWAKANSLSDLYTLVKK